MIAFVPGDEVIHQRILQRGGALGRIFELQLVIRQLALRLLDAGFRQFPKIRGRIHDERKLLFFLRHCLSGSQRERNCNGQCYGGLHISSL